MADLSPSAEAVLNAVTFQRYDVPHQACARSIDQIRADAAAVLRAALDQSLEWNGRVDREWLYDLAAELDGTSSTSTSEND